MFSRSSRGDRSHLHGTHPREGRTPACLGLATNRGPGFERDPASPGDLRAPESASWGCGRTGPATGVAGRRRHLHGGLARPALRRLRRHRREWVTAAARLPSLPKIADALSQGKLSFDQVKPLVEVAKPETDARLAEQATHWSAKQVRELAQAARNQSDERSTGAFARRFLRFDDRRRTLTGTLPRGPVRRRQELAHRPSQPSRPRSNAVRPADGGCTGLCLQSRRSGKGRGRPELKRVPLRRVAPAATGPPSSSTPT